MVLRGVPFRPGEPGVFLCGLRCADRHFQPFLQGGERDFLVRQLFRAAAIGAGNVYFAHGISSNSSVTYRTGIFFLSAFAISVRIPADMTLPNTLTCSHFVSSTVPINRASSRSAGLPSSMNCG